MLVILISNFSDIEIDGNLFLTNLASLTLTSLTADVSLDFRDLWLAGRRLHDYIHQVTV